MKTIFHDKEIHFHTKGKGTPLLLLHGFLKNKSVWGNLEEKLSPHFKLIAIDLPGHGKTASFSDVHSMEMMGQIAIHILQNLKITKAILVGHSMGGYVSLAITENYPQMVEGVVLLNSNTWEDSQEKKNDRGRTIKIINSQRESFITGMITNLFESQKKFQKEIQNIIDGANKMSKNAISSALRGMKIRKDRTEILKSLDKKLVITGLNDPLVDYNTISDICLETNSKLITTRGHHMSFIEDEDATAKSIIQNFS